MRVTDAQRLRSSRQDTRRAIRHENLHRKHNIRTTPILREFSNHLQTLLGGNSTTSTALDKTSKLSRFLYWCDSTCVTLIHATNSAKIVQYLEHIREVTPIQASTLSNEGQNFITFYAYLAATQKPFNKTDSEKKFVAAIDTFKKNLRNLKVRRRVYNRQNMLPTATLEEGRLALGQVGKISNLLPEMEELARNHSGLDSHDRNMLTSFIASWLALLNGARESHIRLMTLGDFHARKTLNRHGIVFVPDAKVAGRDCCITFTPEQVTFVMEYLGTVRKDILGDRQASLEIPLLVNNAGNPLKNISTKRRMYAIMQKAHFTQMFNLTKWRVLITTAAARHYSDSLKKQDLVNNYLCHSNEVAEMYYNAPLEDKEVFQSYNLLQDLFEGDIVDE